MTRIIDVAYPVDRYALGLRRAGVETVIRYYSRDSAPSAAKRLHRPEAQALAAAGLRIGAVYEGRRGNDITYFGHATGVQDGAYARVYAQSAIGQPEGSTIYFGVDTDADIRRGKDQINRCVIPYFKGIAEAFARDGGTRYVVGVYGSGAVCQALLDAGLVQMTWLAQSTGWMGYQAFLASGRWNLLQAMDTTVAEVRCDPNTSGAGQAIGDFLLDAPAASTADGTGMKYVNARSGLRLRAGPGVDFEVRSLLRYGTPVHPLGNSGSWTAVDLQGDSAADGYVSSGFLSDAPGASTTAANASPSRGTADGHHSDADTARIPTLIAQGGSKEGLAEARAEAKTALRGYPKNGCAAHLSALLRESGIDVPMTVGAGKLAAVVERRGWHRIAVGGQRPGDVGVAFDNTNPPGADHIYLVIEALDDDRMLIADNQNTVNAPHERSARGRDGRTGTDYFLRA